MKQANERLILRRVWRSILIAALLLTELVGHVTLVHSWEHGGGGDECQSDYHCLNGGKCMDANLVTDFKHCHCADGFSGPRCSSSCPLQCQHGGLCEHRFMGGVGDVTPSTAVVHQDQPASSRSGNSDDFKCKCSGYFAGPLCEIPYTNCGNHQRCFNGSVCVYGDETNPSQSTGCSCTESFGGDSNCQDRTDVLPKGGRWNKRLTRKGRVAALVLSGLLVSLILFYAPVLLSTRTSRPVKFIFIETTVSNPVGVSTTSRETSLEII